MFREANALAIDEDIHVRPQLFPLVDDTIPHRRTFLPQQRKRVADRLASPGDGDDVTIPGQIPKRTRKYETKRARFRAQDSDPDRSYENDGRQAVRNREP